MHAIESRAKLGPKPLRWKSASNIITFFFNPFIIIIIIIDLNKQEQDYTGMHAQF